MINSQETLVYGMCLMSLGFAICAIILSSIGPYKLGRLHGIKRARQSARNREHKRKIRQSIKRVSDKYRDLLK